jgi:hypothetical protein
MPLHMTKIAFGCDTLNELQQRLSSGERRAAGRAVLTTRYLPKRHEEMGGGSLYWIIAHRIAARSPIIAFEPSPEGKTHIVIEPRAIPVLSVPKRAHQGWRYLKPEDAPRDLREGETDISELPSELAANLTKLGLV